MIVSNEVMSLMSAIDEFQEYIVKNYGMDSATAQSYLEIVDRLRRFAEESNLSSVVVLKAFYTKTIGVPAFQPPQRKSSERIARTVFMIMDLLHGNKPKRRYLSRQVACPSGYEKDLENYKAIMVLDQKSEGTVRTRAGRIIVFFIYLSNSGCQRLESITRDILLGFVLSLNGRYSSQGRASILYTVRNFFSYSEFLSRISFDPAPFLTGLHSRKHERLSSFYTADEVCRLLEAVERDTPWGKTVYLMMLLASIYGLRSSDIKALSLDNIDWKRRTLSVIQYKTKKQIVLPIIDEVLYALLDYLKNVRPDSSYRNVFIRLRRPYVPYSMNDHFGDKIKPYFEKAGINTEGKHHGLHSLRHSLATNLLNGGISLNDIASILGHSSASSTKTYVWSDIENLRSAVMEVPGHD